MGRAEIQKKPFVMPDEHEDTVKEQEHFPRAGERWRDAAGVIYSIVGFCYDGQTCDREVIFRPDQGGGPAISQSLGHFLGLVPSGPRAGARRFTFVPEVKSQSADGPDTDDLINKIASAIEQ